MDRMGNFIRHKWVDLQDRRVLCCHSWAQKMLARFAIMVRINIARGFPNAASRNHKGGKFGLRSAIFFL